MTKKKNGDDGLPISPYKIYNIGKFRLEIYWILYSFFSEELVRANVIPEHLISLIEQLRTILIVTITVRLKAK